MITLTDFIASHVSLSAEETKQITSAFSQRNLRKGSYLLRKGQLAGHYYFIQSGGLRVFFQKKDKEVTGWIALEGNFFAELASLKSSQPSHFNIQAIEHTVVLMIGKEDMENLYKRFPAWQAFGRKIWEDAFLRVVNAIIAFQTMTAQERYAMMMQQSDLLERIPLKDLSSYLGVTPNSLSRIRKNLK